MKILKYILLFLITINVEGQNIYEAPKNNSQVLNSADIPVDYVTGIPNIGIDLFSAPTINPNFRLDLKLQYDLYANSSNWFTTNQFGDTWRLSIIPKISRKSSGEKIPISEIQLTDEMYYEAYPSTGTRNQTDVFTYEVFGLTGKFRLKRFNTNYSVEIIEQNDYAKIEIETEIESYEDNILKSKIKAFTITDKNGIKFVFSSYDYHKLSANEEFSIDFHLSKVFDKFENLLCEFNYEETIRRQSSLANFFLYKHSKIIKQININKIGVIEINKINFGQDRIIFKNTNNQIFQNILFKYYDATVNASNGIWNKKILGAIEFQNSNNSVLSKYEFEYNTRNLKKPAISSMGFLVNSDECSLGELTDYKENLYFDHWVLKKIKNPNGGTTFFEFEPNDFNFSIASNSNDLQYHIQHYKENNSENFYFQNIPLLHESSKNRYLIQYPNLANSDGNVYISYSGNEYNSGVPSLPLPGWPSNKVFPGLQIATYLNNSNFYTIQKTLNINHTQCNLGYKIQMYGIGVALIYDAGHLNAYTSISAKAKIFKTENIKKYVYGNGLRIKRITTFDTDVKMYTFESSINKNVPKNITTYEYKMFNDANKSSGQTKYTTISGQVNELQFNNYSDLILYKNVSVKTSGLGEIRYTYDDPNFTSLNSSSGFPENSFIKKLPIKIAKYDENGIIVEENIFSRNFKIFNPNATGINKQPIITFEKTTNRNFIRENKPSKTSEPSKTYEPSKVLELSTEITFDTISRNIISKKIINSTLGESFEEKNTYIKLNDAYLPKTVDKFKNGIALNRSENFYTPQNCRIGFFYKFFYNLNSTQIAKADLPLEIENEFTRYSCSGQLIEYKTKDGVYVSQIWGYYGAFVIAELQNIKYENINQSIITQLVNASNLLTSASNDQTVRTKVNELRTLHPEAKIKSYTYNPLIGITSMTDFNGLNEFYEYDDYNRLYRIKDHKNFILKEYNYNYIN